LPATLLVHTICQPSRLSVYPCCLCCLSSLSGLVRGSSSLPSARQFVFLFSTGRARYNFESFSPRGGKLVGHRGSCKSSPAQGCQADSAGSLPGGFGGALCGLRAQLSPALRVGLCVASGPSSAKPSLAQRQPGGARCGLRAQLSPALRVWLCVASGPSSAQPSLAERQSGAALCGLRAQLSPALWVGLCGAPGPSSAQPRPAAIRRDFVEPATRPCFVGPPGPAQPSLLAVGFRWGFVGGAALEIT